MEKTVVVFGSTGAIGLSLIEIIVKEQPTWQILAVSRSGKSDRTSSIEAYPTVKIVQGDIENEDQVLHITKEKVDIVFCCIGFAKYERKYWARHWPIVINSLITASKANPSKKYVFCDNLYAYGPRTHITTASKTLDPSTKSKPQIRAQLRQTLSSYMSENPTRMTVVGAADFFGPHATVTSFLGDTMTGNLCQGQRPMAIGSADVVHDFCYTVDFARALYTVSLQPTAFGRFWIAPHAIRGKTLKQIASDIGEKVGSKKQIKVLPKSMVSVLAVFITFMAEIKEMLPFWMQDYTVDGGEEFTREFNVQATPYDEALQGLVDFYKKK